MAVIKITQFGGIAPSVDPRNLAPDGAQTATNLDMRFGDFRPSKGVGASVASVASGTQSIFKTPSGVWLSSATDTNYVNGQISDAATERVYLTGRSAFPEAWQGGVYRRLGVPAPTTAPIVVPLVVDEYTPEEVDALYLAALNSVTTAIANTSTDALIGTAPIPTAPGGGTTQTDTGDTLNLWTLSPQDPAGNFTTSLVLQTTVGGGSRYVTIRDEGSAAYAYRDFGITGAGTVSMAVDVSFNHPGVNNSWFSRREAQIYVQTTSSGAGVLVRLIDYDGMRGEPNAAFLTIHNTTAWGVQGAEVVRVQLAAKLTKQTLYKLTGAVVDNGNGTQTVTATLNSATGAALGTASATAAFVKGGYCGFMQRDGPDANGSVDGFTDGFLTYWDNFAITSSTPNGFWLYYTTDVGTPTLPVSTAGSYALTIPMSANLSTTDLANASQAYLKDAALGGVQITYLGVRYWAVPVNNYMGLGRSAEKATLTAALAALMQAQAPTQRLLSDALVTTIVDYTFAVFTGTDPVTSALYVTLRAAQNALLALVSQQASVAGSAGKTAAFQTALANLSAASAAVNTWWANYRAFLLAYLTAAAKAEITLTLPGAVTRIFESRGYIVTYVTDWDEESAPGEPSDLKQVDQNDSVTITAATPPALRNIVGWRLYRSSTTNTGAPFQLIEDKLRGVLAADGTFKYFSIANLVYVDTKLQEELQENCPTLTWAEPPALLKGLVGLPNGIMLGFVDKTLYACEPFTPYAWPVEYAQPLEFKIVGIGVFGQTAVVLTEGNPYYVSGADSASLSSQKLESPQACIAKRTIAPVEGGVMYASPDGLCLATPSGVSVFTQGAFDKAAWQSIATSGAFGAFHEGVYYLFTV